MFEILFPKEQVAKSEQREEEDCLVELRGVDFAGNFGEMNAQKAVRFHTVATAREKATYSTERVRNDDTTRGNGNDIHKPRLEFFSKNCVADEEGNDPAD